MPIFRYTYDGELLQSYPDATSASAWLISHGIIENIADITKRMESVHAIKTRWYVPCIYEFRWSNVDFTGKRWPKIPKHLDIDSDDYIAAYLRRNISSKSRTDIKRELTDLVGAANMMMKVNRKLKERMNSSPVYQYDINTGTIIKIHDNRDNALNWILEDGYSGTDLVGDFRNYMRKHNNVVGMFYGYMWSLDDNINNLCGFNNKPIYRFSLDGKLIAAYNNISEVVKWTIDNKLASAFYWCMKNIKASIKTKQKSYGYLWAYEDKIIPVQQKKKILSGAAVMLDAGVKIYRFSKSGELLGEHSDRKDACDFISKLKRYPDSKMNSIRTAIAQVLSGKMPSAYGFIWSYESEVN